MSEHWGPGSATIKVAAEAFAGESELVLVDLLLDEVYDLAPSASGDWLVIEDLPLVDYPLIIAKKSDIPLM
jgi:hypothetical protein